MRIAICDDDEATRDLIHGMLNRRFGESCCLFTYQDGQELVDHYKNRYEPFDILVMDIIMLDLDGFSAAKKIRKYDSSAVIIFATTSSDYSIAGYDVDAFGYILKPIDEKTLIDFVKRAIEKIQFREITITVQFGYNYKKIRTIDIMYIEKRSRCSYFVLRDGSEEVCNCTLKEICTRLPNNGFILTDQSFIVNLQHIIGVDQANKVAVLRNKKLIPVSRPRVKAVLDAFVSYSRG